MMPKCPASSIEQRASTRRRRHHTGEKIQQRAVEQRRPLQRREVAAPRQRHQTNAGDAVAQVSGAPCAAKRVKSSSICIFLPSFAEVEHQYGIQGV